MGYRVIISSEAAEDTLRAYRFYEKEQATLGERFLLELNILYNKLSRNPTWYSYLIKEKNIRFISSKVFPYSVVYEEHDEEVYVFAIHHHRQNLKTLLKRI
jgi:mRNA-degrading endonuclease RelE of RelBE toxin-antitoxin system